MPGTITDPERRARVTDLAAGTLLGNDFRIERRLGAGGMGAVYVARQLSTGRDRAIKVMHGDLAADGELRARFEREIHVIASIGSDHVVDVIAAGVEGSTGMPWFAMELLDGESLAARLLREGMLAPAVAREVVVQLGHALAMAHRAGVVHRDLKPENIFLETPRREGAPFVLRVLDFGIAKVVSPSTTRATAPLGTPVWMAPEQTLSEGMVKTSTDVWAFGLIVFWMLTGKLYWLGANRGASSPAVIVREIAVDEIVPASARATALGVAHLLPPAFDEWFARCVVRDLAQRFHDGGEARTALLAVLDGVPCGATKATSVPKKRRELSARRLAAPAVVAVIAAFAIARSRRNAHQETAADAPPSGSLISQPLASVEAEADMTPAGEIDEDQTTAWRVPVGDSPTLGPADAAVTVVTFADFECPFAKMISGRLRALRRRYPDALRLVWKDLPLGIHMLSEPASMLARSALAQKGEAGFWAAHDKLYAAPRNKEQPAIGEGDLLRLAAGLGLDPRRTAADLRERHFNFAIAIDVSLSEELRVDAAPTSFINGRRVAGAQPEELFAKIIDEEIAHAEKLVANGVPRALVYATMMDEARPGPGTKLSRATLAAPDSAPSYGGGPDALVIQELGDHLDIFSKATDRALHLFVEGHGARVRLLWRDAPNPKNSDSLQAAAAGQAAFEQGGPAAFWKMHELMAAYASERGRIDDQALRRCAAEAGVEPGTLRYTLREPKRVERDIVAAREAGLESPAIVVGDIAFKMIPPMPTLERVVEQALAARARGDAR
jgi:protein-disulfide isomerase